MGRDIANKECLWRAKSKGGSIHWIEDNTLEGYGIRSLEWDH